ncbi:DEAD/DEAH box helicase [Paenibacillaceae bacterium]|nr:DEAD/DEAH box helicase [Paenibacillaceae bacterium]
MNNVTWEGLSVRPDLAERLQEGGITTPTPVQAEAVPAMLEGRDVIAHSQTGSGKTLAYLVPILQQLDVESKLIQAVIIAPTQELAMQIVQVAKQYGDPIGIRTQQLIGGAALQRQLDKLKEHPQLVVGTPGRLHELLKLRKLRMHETKFIVIDEADQVFGLGSTKEVTAILERSGRNRSLAFFSATFPETMTTLQKKWMNDPVYVAISPELRVAASVEHKYLVCDSRDKMELTRRVIRTLEPSSALLFLNDTSLISHWQSKLSYEGFTVEVLYGDSDKIRRADTLTRFRDGRCQLLLATDVAARGLDIAGLPLVINLEPAITPDHYVHRAGRTGRMGRHGLVISFVSVQEIFIMNKFRKQLGIDIVQSTLSRGSLVPVEESRGQSGRQRSNGPARSESGQRSEGTPRGETGGGGQPAANSRHSAKSGAPSRAGNSSEVKHPSSKAETAARPRSASISSQAPARAADKRQNDRKREQDRKNKGAPKWLKAKRNQ